MVVSSTTVGVAESLSQAYTLSVDSPLVAAEQATMVPPRLPTEKNLKSPLVGGDACAWEVTLVCSGHSVNNMDVAVRRFALQDVEVIALEHHVASHVGRRVHKRATVALHSRIFPIGGKYVRNSYVYTGVWFYRSVKRSNKLANLVVGKEIHIHVVVHNIHTYGRVGRSRSRRGDSGTGGNSLR